jgi:hypothetical protein
VIHHCFNRFIYLSRIQTLAALGRLLFSECNCTEGEAKIVELIYRHTLPSTVAQYRFLRVVNEVYTKQKMLRWKLMDKMTAHSRPCRTVLIIITSHPRLLCEHLCTTAMPLPLSAPTFSLSSRSSSRIYLIALPSIFHILKLFFLEPVLASVSCDYAET